MRLLPTVLAAALLAAAASVRAETFFELCDKAQASPDPAAQVAFYTQALGAWMPADTEANRALVFNNRGTSQMALKQYDKALADYDAALGIAPRDAATLENRATILEALNKTDAALLDYGRALALDPNRPKSYHNRALIHIRKGDSSQALKDLNRLLAVSPHDAQGFNLRAGVHERLRDRERALADYKSAMEEAPDDPAPWVNRGLLFSRESRTNAAGADFVKAAELYRKLRKPELEMSELERAVQTAPASAHARAARGAAQLARGNIVEAETDALKAVALNPKEPSGEILLGRVSLERGDLEAAGRFFEARSDEGAGRVGLAFTAFRRGKLADARARWKKALARSPSLAQGIVGAEEAGYAFTAKETEAFKALFQTPVDP